MHYLAIPSTWCTNKLNPLFLAQGDHVLGKVVYVVVVILPPGI